MAERVRHVYEVMDASGATIGFAPSIPLAKRIITTAEPGAKMQRIAIPMSPVEFCKFLTEKAGGAS